MAEPTVSTADAIASVAIVVSLLTWLYTVFIEHRIKRRDDRRALFDASVGLPFFAKLDLLEPILLQLNVICSERDVIVRAKTLSDLQRKDHTAWYMTVTSFLDAQDYNYFGAAHNETNDYWDKMSDIINDLSSEADASKVIHLLKEVNSLGQRYLTRQRTGIHHQRSLT